MATTGHTDFPTDHHNDHLDDKDLLAKKGESSATGDNSLPPKKEGSTGDDHSVPGKKENGLAGGTEIVAIPNAATPAIKIRRLEDDEMKLIYTYLGVPHKDPETQPPIRKPLSFLWPPKALPEGLYRSAVTERCKSQWSYYFTSTLYNVCIVLQLVLGAAMTALASHKTNETAITILAAANTVNAGLVALLHNSGLPNRIRNDWNEYAKAELHITELLDTGIVEDWMKPWDAVDRCYKTFKKAKETVQSNKPAVYSQAGVTTPVQNQTLELKKP